VGWWCIDELANRSGITLGKANRHTQLGEGYLRGFQIALAKPQQFVNRSGNSADHMLRRYNSRPAQLVVLTDDMALKPGKIRIRAQGSAGGHNGLKSIIQVLGTDEFVRIRLGIGRPGLQNQDIDHVLTSFPPDELAEVKQAVLRAADAAESILITGVDETMSEFN
jgi:PTH1 family peptidyl-tRNA hydrolase